MANLNTFSALLLIAALTATMAACDRYRVTLNEQPIAEPRPLIKVIAAEDPQLRNCIQQFIIDQQIRDTSNLTALNCSHGGINSVSGIEQFSQLRILDLAGNNITDITPLLFLGKVTTLNLEDNTGLSCQQLVKLEDQLPANAAVNRPEHCQQ
jgi:Leucine-rich repeat (LRR) protein